MGRGRQQTGWVGVLAGLAIGCAVPEATRDAATDTEADAPAGSTGGARDSGDDRDDDDADDDDAASSTTTTGQGDGSTSGDGSSTDDDEDRPDDGSTGAPVDACWEHVPPPTCDLAAGGHVYCVLPGDTIDVAGHVQYGPGFPEGLPALGLGRPGLGYFAVADPMTCAVQLCTNAIGTGNSTLSEGKICEANFDHDVPGTTQGSALYRVTVAGDAAPGDYPVGFTANTGATILSPDFILRVLSPPP